MHCSILSVRKECTLCTDIHQKGHMLSVKGNRTGRWWRPKNSSRGIQVFWEVMRALEQQFEFFKGIWPIFFRAQHSKKYWTAWPLDCLTLKIKATQSSEQLGIIGLMTWHHIPEELIFSNTTMRTLYLICLQGVKHRHRFIWKLLAGCITDRQSWYCYKLKYLFFSGYTFAVFVRSHDSKTLILDFCVVHWI